MFGELIKAKWKCPICGQTGRKWITPGRSQSCGRRHIRKKHNRKDIYPLLECRKMILKNKSND